MYRCVHIDEHLFRRESLGAMTGCSIPLSPPLTYSVRYWTEESKKHQTASCKLWMLGFYPCLDHFPGLFGALEDLGGLRCCGDADAGIVDDISFASAPLKIIHQCLRLTPKRDAGSFRGNGVMARDRSNRLPAQAIAIFAVCRAALYAVANL